MVSVSVVKEWIEVTNGCLAMREDTTENLDPVDHTFAKSKKQFLLHLYHKQSGTFYKIK